MPARRLSSDPAAALASWASLAVRSFSIDLRADSSSSLATSSSSRLWSSAAVWVPCPSLATSPAPAPALSAAACCPARGWRLRLPARSGGRVADGRTSPSNGCCVASDLPPPSLSLPLSLLLGGGALLPRALPPPPSLARRSELRRGGAAAGGMPSSMATESIRRRRRAVRHLVASFLGIRLRTIIAPAYLLLRGPRALARPLCRGMNDRVFC
jgi:hypothetical protein